ncbi:hypothetical protein C8R47DRAFT_1249379 [Mycena vitilis]|nr:hypothetical protein C8R47DRAFT_1249379 [Mycena vitilis]
MAETTPEEVPKPTPEAEPVKVEATPTPPETAETTTEVPAVETVIASAPTPAPAPVPAAAESHAHIPSEATSAPTEPAPAAAPPRERELVADPRLSVLRAMFPDFDDSLLQSVLDSVQGNTDRAIDALLGMSEQPPAQQQAPQTQEDLDEQLARTLMLEDERQEHVWGVQQQPQQGQRPQAPGQESTAAGQDKDTMQEFQEQFNKFAKSAALSPQTRISAGTGEAEYLRREGHDLKIVQSRRPSKPRAVGDRAERETVLVGPMSTSWAGSGVLRMDSWRGGSEQREAVTTALKSSGPVRSAGSDSGIDLGDSGGDENGNDHGHASISDRNIKRGARNTNR